MGTLKTFTEIIHYYAAAIVAGDSQQIENVFSSDIKIKPPGTNHPHEGQQKVAIMLSTAATVIKDLKFKRSFHTTSNWGAILLEGVIDGTPVQIIDNLHINEHCLIDQINVFLRPSLMGEVLLAKVIEETGKRTDFQSGK
jgi:hypothetical protein